MRKFLKISGVVMASACLLYANGNANECKAATSQNGEHPIAGFTLSLENYYNSIEKDDTVSTMALLSVPINLPKNLGVAKVDNYLNIRKSPGMSEKIVGQLPKNAGCTVLDTDDDWTKIKSGKVTGYVKSEYLLTGSAAEAKAQEVGRVVATVSEGGLRIREKASTDASILDVVGEGEQFEVDEEKDENATTWVKICIDNEYGYVAKEYVTLAYELKKAVVSQEVSGVSSVRTDLVNQAKKYLGNRYVWGGTSLTSGVDCSGYVQQLFRMFGYSLPRTSRAQAGSGTTINSANAKAGDLVFYGNSGGINHVAICIGNGQIIHASNPRDGIKISNMYYRTPAKVVRIINN